MSTGDIDATAVMRQVADTCGRAGIAPVRATVDAGITGTPKVNILTRTRSDLFALCDQTGTKHPEPALRSPVAAADGQVHYSTITKAGWVLRCVSFPHHPDRQVVVSGVEVGP